MPDQTIVPPLSALRAELTANASGANAVRTDRTSGQTNRWLRQLIVAPAAPLTTADRERVHHALRGLRLAADRLEEALDTNRQADALHAATLGTDAGQVCGAVAAQLGRP